VIEVKLYAADGDYIVTVLVPNMDELPRVLLWGSRVFSVGADGRFREASSRQVFTHAEYNVMMREGICT
jgi:hypothetical protein